MICQFSVTNFGCFRDTATLDLQAASLSEHNETIFQEEDGESFLPLAVIYGPNGGGKSTVLRAISMFILTVLRPIQATAYTYETIEERSKRMESTAIITPFRFSDKAEKTPTQFELFFRIKNNEFHYVLHILKEKIVFEQLSRITIHGKQYSLLFERNTQSINLMGYFNKYTVSDIPNHLPLLSYLIITHGKNAILQDIKEWFEKRIQVWDFGNPIIDSHINVVKDNKIKEIILQMFAEMDIDITDYRVVKDENGDIKNIVTTHTVQGKKYELELYEESMGTIKLFSTIPLIVRALAMGSTLIIDELDAKLHPVLIRYIMNLFSNPETNKRKAQLLFTSQDISTMSLDLLRRDEIWFVAKSAEQAAKLYSLVEFKISQDSIQINADYLEGRYGADPYLKKLIDWSKEP